jgi:hypothetical protein
MAATIQIHEMSSLTAGVDKTSGTVRFKAADNATVDANNPLAIPSGATITYSYTKKLRPYMEAPPSVSVSNLRWYTDGGGFGTGISVNVKNLGVTWGANYNTEMSGGADLFGKTATSPPPLDGDATDAGPFVPADDDTYIGDLIELQMAIASTATQGALAAETLTLAYDEI